jgi:hypothetical protein
MSTAPVRGGKKTGNLEHGTAGLFGHHIACCHVSITQMTPNDDLVSEISCFIYLKCHSPECCRQDSALELPVEGSPSCNHSHLEELQTVHC